MLQDPPVRDDRHEVDRPKIPRSTSPTSTWRFASRLARREVRRRPGRTLLVMALVMIPVFAMTLGIVSGRTASQTLDEKWQTDHGNADAVVTSINPFELGDRYVDDYEPLELPAGSTTVDYEFVFTGLVGLDDDGEEIDAFVQYTDFPVDSAIAGASVTLVDGRLPTGPVDVALTRDVADRFGAEVGQTLALVDPDVDWNVVGIIEKASSLDEDWVLVDEIDTTTVLADSIRTVRLVDYPDDFTLAEETALVDSVDPQRTAVITDGLRSRRDWRGAEAGLDPVVVFGGWVAGVVGFIAVGIVIAAAFAASARRQLVTIGQLSANGAPARLIRRTLALQGTWSGFIGAVVGVAAAVATARVGLSTIETIVGKRSDGLVVRPLDIAVIVATAVVAASIAALIPSKSSAKLPVLAALAGRRPVASPPKWMAPTGLALFGGGLALLAAASGAAGAGQQNMFPAAMAVIGGLGVLFGMVCCSPFVVSAIGWLSHRLKGSMRLAARSLSRTRGRSAAVVTAIATVMALSTAGLTTAQSVAEEQTQNQRDGSTLTFRWSRDIYEQPGNSGIEVASDLPPLRTDLPFDELITPDPLPTDRRTAIADLLPDAEWIPLRTVDADSRVGGGSITIADPAVLERLTIPDEQRELLAQTGAVALTPFSPRSITVTTADGGQRLDVGPPLPQALWDDGSVEPVYGIWADILVTEERALSEGLPIRTTAFLVDNPTDLTEQQIDVVDGLQREQFGNRTAFVAPGEPTVIDRSVADREGQWFIDRPYIDDPFPADLVLLGALIATLLLVLAVVAIGLSLAATEGRDERSVLHAVGAAPRSLRRLAASKAVMLTFAAALSAVPTGYIVMAVVFAVNDRPWPFPWIGAATLLVAVPVIAGLSTLSVSALGQRFRPAQALTAGN